MKKSSKSYHLEKTIANSVVHVCVSTHAFSHHGSTGWLIWVGPQCPCGVSCCDSQGGCRLSSSTLWAPFICVLSTFTLEGESTLRVLVARLQVLFYLLILF